MNEIDRLIAGETVTLPCGCREWWSDWRVKVDSTNCRMQVASRALAKLELGNIGLRGGPIMGVTYDDY